MSSKSYYEKGNFAIVPNLKQIMGLSEGGLKVYLAVCRFADDEGGCFPANSAIAEFTGLSESGARKAMYELRDRGLVEVTRRKRPNGSAASNYYQLLIIHSSQVPVPTRTGDLSSPGHPLTIPIEQLVPKGTGADAPGPPKDENQILTEFYRVMKLYSLVALNHNHVRKWADNLRSSLGAATSVALLQRLQQRDLREERKTNEFVPQLTKAIDIVNKAGAFIDYYTRTKPARDSRSYE